VAIRKIARDPAPAGKSARFAVLDRRATAAAIASQAQCQDLIEVVLSESLACGGDVVGQLGQVVQRAPVVTFDGWILGMPGELVAGLDGRPSC